MNSSGQLIIGGIYRAWGHEAHIVSVTLDNGETALIAVLENGDTWHADENALAGATFLRNQPITPAEYAAARMQARGDGMR